MDIPNLVKFILSGPIYGYFRSDSDCLIHSVSTKCDADIVTKETGLCMFNIVCAARLAICRIALVN